MNAVLLYFNFNNNLKKDKGKKKYQIVVHRKIQSEKKANNIQKEDIISERIFQSF